MPVRDRTKELAIEWLKRDEGLRLFPYLDTADPPKLTIGYGRNIEENGLSEAEAEMLLANDYQVAKNDAKKYIGEASFDLLKPSAQAVLTCMAFNLGINRLKKFIKLKACIHAGDMAGAQREMLNSKWATQVGARANRLAEALLQE